jgi:tetratricopeptide (TPR) repeat protein
MYDLRIAQPTASVWLAVCGLVTLCSAQAWAQDCGEVPADPNRIEILESDPDQAYDLSEKGYQAFERKDFHCAAYYNLVAYQHQPDAVLMQNIANALRDGGQLDAAMRYARKTLALNPEKPDVDAASALIADATAELSKSEYIRFRLSDYDASAIVIEWVRYEAGDEPWVAKGNLTVTIERVGAPASKETIQVPKPQAKVELPPPPPPASDWRQTAGIIGSAVGGSLLVTALVLDTMVGSQRDDYDGLRACLEGRSACADTRTRDDYDKLGEDIASLHAMEVSTLIAGVLVTAVGGGILAWSLLDEGADAEASVGLLPAPDGGHVTLQLRF